MWSDSYLLCMFVYFSALILHFGTQFCIKNKTAALIVNVIDFLFNIDKELGTNKSLKICMNSSRHLKSE